MLLLALGVAMLGIFVGADGIKAFAIVAKVDGVEAVVGCLEFCKPG
jgi:hypothetical protein